MLITILSVHVSPNVTIIRLCCNMLVLKCKTLNCEMCCLRSKGVRMFLLLLDPFAISIILRIGMSDIYLSLWFLLQFAVSCLLPKHSTHSIKRKEIIPIFSGITTIILQQLFWVIHADNINVFPAGQLACYILWTLKSFLIY